MQKNDAAFSERKKIAEIGKRRKISEKASAGLTNAFLLDCATLRAEAAASVGGAKPLDREPFRSAKRAETVALANLAKLAKTVEPVELAKLAKSRRLREPFRDVFRPIGEDNRRSGALN